MAYKSINWQSVKTMHHYTAITKNNEVDCRSLVNIIHLQHPNVLTATWADNKTCTSVTSGVDDSSELPNDALFDVIIVPMLGFNNDRHRLGYGGGFYDRFLAAQPQAKTIGLCFSSGRIVDLPVEDHDIALQIIITENGLV